MYLLVLWRYVACPHSIRVVVGDRGNGTVFDVRKEGSVSKCVFHLTTVKHVWLERLTVCQYVLHTYVCIVS